jgi:hypothetical protein
MGYAIALIVVLLLVAGAVTFFVLNAAKGGGGAEPEDPGAEGTPAGVASPDESPLGDTTEHAGEHQEGHTTDEPERGGTGGGQDDRPRVGDPGPEAESGGPQPESERLADRPR